MSGVMETGMDGSGRVWCCGCCAGGRWNALACECRVAAGTINGWREEFLAAGREGLKSRPRPEQDCWLVEAQRKVGELSMELDILRGLNEEMDRRHRRPRRWTSVDGWSSRWPGSAGVAGVSRSAACEQRRRRSTSEPCALAPRRRPGPVGAMPDGELLVAI
jgi:hypothetical protein